MFCVNCGNKLEEQWKVCPQCGTEVIREKEDIVVEEPQKQVCEKCGNELQDDWVKCPFCGYTKEGDIQQSAEKNGNVNKFEFEGFRRTGRFGFKYYKSEIEMNGEELHATIHKKKVQDVTFMKQQISEIKFPILPVFGVWDIICIVLFLVLMLITYGMSIFAVFFFVKMTLVKHMQINLQNGNKINIPIRQKAETAEFLRGIGWNENFITSVEASAISDRKLRFREWIISGLMFAIASVTVTIGAETYLENREANDTESYEQDDVVRSLEEVGGYEAWVESEYASKVRTDIVVMLPVTEREADTYAVRICTSLGDIIYVKHEDGALATEWGWLMNAVPDIEGGDTATFQATLTIDGYTVFEDEEAIPIFIVEDVEAYVVPQSDAIENDVVEENTEEVVQEVPETQIDFTIINEYIHIMGYGSLFNGYSIYFDGIEGNNLKFRIVQDDILVAEDSAIIVDGNKAEYKTENGELIFTFYNYTELQLSGYLGPHHLTDTYYGQWS